MNIADEKVLVQAAAHAWRIDQLARLHVHFERQEDTILALQHSVAELRVELDSERRTAHGLAVQSWATAAQVEALAAERDALETRQASHLEMIETLVEMEAEEHRRRLELEAQAEEAERVERLRVALGRRRRRRRARLVRLIVNGVTAVICVAAVHDAKSKCAPSHTCPSSEAPAAALMACQCTWNHRR